MSFDADENEIREAFAEGRIDWIVAAYAEVVKEKEAANQFYDLSLAKGQEWQRKCFALEAEIERLKGIINADDERLRTAEIRVFGDSTWGCDAADAMADKVLELRNEIERLRKALEWIAVVNATDREYQAKASAALEGKP